MLPDRVSNPGPLTYESGALPIALRGPAKDVGVKDVGVNAFLTEQPFFGRAASSREANRKWQKMYPYTLTPLHSEQPKLYGVLAVLSAKGLKHSIHQELFV